MTRNERPDFGLYDEDFYSWTQQQAAALHVRPQEATEAIAWRGEGWGFAPLFNRDRMPSTSKRPQPPSLPFPPWGKAAAGKPGKDE